MTQTLDANLKRTENAYDALGRITATWAPNRSKSGGDTATATFEIGRASKMADLPRRGILWWLAAAVAVSAAALAGSLVSTSEVGSAPRLTAANVEGVWAKPGGGRLTVRADGSADLEQAPVSKTECGQDTGRSLLTYTGTAAWVFDTHPDEASGIRFDFSGAAAQQSCRIYLVVYDEAGGRGFIPHDDGDVPYTRKAAPHPGLTLKGHTYTVTRVR
ncbi:hypothetical protein [Streptomyces venezuelae]|uniref:hypothetical protein n=1 Tax=Streptomyces venezuelae TaxID=54571 RepID=UPI0036386EC2